MQGVYNLLSDHDSCWRDSWDEIKTHVHAKYDEFTKGLTKKQLDHNISHLTTIGEMRSLPIDSRESYDCKVGHSVSYKDGVIVITNVEKEF